MTPDCGGTGMASPVTADAAVMHEATGRKGHLQNAINAEAEEEQEVQTRQEHDAAGVREAVSRRPGGRALV